MQKMNKRNEERKMRSEMRIIIHENNKYRDCGARGRRKDEFD
ncbi:hypothetical protein JOC93_002628 [Priestia taiwanensis]|nr:hypothetical protein [Priestia taiwanensis]